LAGVEQQALRRAALIAAQRIEGVQQLELRLERTVAAAAQTLRLRLGLTDPFGRTRLQVPAPALHLPLDGRGHDTEPEQLVESPRSELASKRGAIGRHEDRSDLAPVALDRDVDDVGCARSLDRDVAVREQRFDLTLGQRLGAQVAAFRGSGGGRSVVVAVDHDGRLAASDDQRRRMSFVDGAVHAGVELVNRAVEARRDATAATDRVTDHEALDSETREERIEHVALGALVAESRAPVPVRAVGLEHRVAVGRIELPGRFLQSRCVGLLRSARGQPLLRKLRPGMELVAWLDQAGRRERR
jgi:hypothetical protein